jgi:hypothetical protein
VKANQSFPQQAMLGPFHNELDEVFRGDRSIWLKIGGSAFVCASGALLHFNADPKATIAFELAMIAAMAVIGAVIGLMLSLRDVVRRRLAAGKPVNLLLRLYLGGGMGTLLGWILTIFGLAILCAVVLAV